MRRYLFRMMGKLAPLALALVALSSCSEFSSETEVAPLRPVDPTLTTVSAVTVNNNPVGTATNVIVHFSDMLGNGLSGQIPALQFYNSSNALSSAVTVNTCSASDGNGNSVCSVTGATAGTYSIHLVSPVSIVGGSINFVQSATSLNIATLASTTYTSGTTFTVSVSVLDGSGVAVTTGAGATASITLSLTSPGTATLSGSTTVSAVGGVATFSGISVDKTGTYTLSATSSGLVTGTSSSFTITAGTEAGIAFTTQPAASTAANVVFATQPIVAVVDSGGNTVTSLACTIHLTMTAPNGSDVLSGTTDMPTSSGVASYTNLSVQSSLGGSTYTISATASGTSCASFPAITSNNFTITLSGVPYQLQLITAPSTAALGEIWGTQPVIHVLDRYGALVSNDNTTVVTISVGSKTANATYTPSTTGSIGGTTSLAAVNGVISFNGLFLNSTTLTDSGTYTWSFAGNYNGVLLGNTTATSVITPYGLEPPFHFTFTAQPTNASLNQVLGSSSTVTIKKYDTNSHLCLTDNSTTASVSLDSGSFATGTITSGTLVQGALSFTNLKVASGTGTHILTASGSGITSGTSSSFVITSFGAAAKLVFAYNIAGGTGATTPWSPAPVVWVEDSAGNLVTNDNSSVVVLTVASYTSPSSGAFNFAGVNTTLTVSNGVADFTGMYNTEEAVTNISLRATATTGGETAAVSNTFSGDAN